MARAPQQRAPQASGEDDFYDDEALYDEGSDGQDDFGSERTEGGAESEGAAERTQGDEGLEEEGLEFEEPPQPRRGEGRIQRLANQNRELQRRLDEIERRGPTRQEAPPAQPRPETEPEMEQRISLLDEAQKGYERWKWSNQQTQQQNVQTRIENALARDEAKFDALCRDDKLAARMRREVEAEFDKRFRAGTFVAKEDIYYWLAGRERARGSQDTRRAREAAQRRVDRQTVRPSQGGSDVRASRRERVDDRTARARRLEGQQI